MWAFDEHRLGLRPVLRRQWAPKGQRPIAVGHPRYEWLYLYGFVHPGTGEVVWFICSTVDAELLSAVLAAFAAAVGAGEGKLIVLVLDNAGWHISGDLAGADRARWREVRASLERRRHARVLRARFRRDPAAYLSRLEQLLRQPALPA